MSSQLFSVTAIICLGIGSGCTTTSPFSEPKEGFAIVRQIQGIATFSSPIESGALAEGNKISAGYQITTGAESFVDLDLRDNGDALRIGADSSVTLAKLNVCPLDGSRSVVNTKIEVIRGHVIANVIRELHRASSYRIRTTNGVAAIHKPIFQRGTCIRAGDSEILVASGTIRFTEPNGQAEWTVEAGSTVINNYHVFVSSENSLTLAIAAIQSIAHVYGWPVVRQSIHQFAETIAVQAASGSIDLEQARQVAATRAIEVVMSLTKAIDQAANTAKESIVAEITQTATLAREHAVEISIFTAVDAAAKAAAVLKTLQGGERAAAQDAGIAAALEAANHVEQLIIKKNALATDSKLLQRQIQQSMKDAVRKRAQIAVEEALKALDLMTKRSLEDVVSVE